MPILNCGWLERSLRDIFKRYESNSAKIPVVRSLHSRFTEAKVKMNLVPDVQSSFRILEKLFNLIEVLFFTTYTCPNMKYLKIRGLLKRFVRRAF